MPGLLVLCNSVETPSMVDPPVEYIVFKIQVNLDHSLLRCDWLWVGHNLCLLLDHLICCIPRIVPVFAIVLNYKHRFVLIYVKNIIWRNLKSIGWSFKTWMGFVPQIGIRLENYFISLVAVSISAWEEVMQHADGHSVITCSGLCGMEVWKLIGALWSGIQRWLGDSNPKGPAMLKTFPSCTSYLIIAAICK